MSTCINEGWALSVQESNVSRQRGNCLPDGGDVLRDLEEHVFHVRNGDARTMQVSIHAGNENGEKAANDIGHVHQKDMRPVDNRQPQAFGLSSHKCIASVKHDTKNQKDVNK